MAGTNTTSRAESEPILVPCPLCEGSAVQGRAVWVYEHGCAFGHYDTEEDPCPECEGTGQLLVEAEPITLEDLDVIFEDEEARP